MLQKTVFLLLIPVFFSCSEEEKPPIPKWDMKESTDLNKELAIEQDIDIQLYLAQHENWKVDTTGTGLYIVWFKKGDGPTPQANQNAKINYKVSLLDGTEVYRTGADEIDVFRVDNAEMESGIHQGIKLMHVGDKAKFIFPSHLAHGLIGDMEKIPPLSPLVVDIELLEIEK
jgi:FKBP-type peptidyl-prolyl cis-trans isomerase